MKAKGEYKIQECVLMATAMATGDVRSLFLAAE